MAIPLNVGLLPNRPLNECIEVGIPAEHLGFDLIGSDAVDQRLRGGVLE